MLHTPSHAAVHLFAGVAAVPAQGNYECAPSVLAEQMSACCRLQDGQLLLDGFVLHRQKNTYGPAQQAHILMRSLKALEGRRDVKKFSVTGELGNHRAGNCTAHQC
jgi:hypothetical protein